MKSIFFSAVLLLSILAITSEAAIQCGMVTTKAAPCLMYATGKQPSPSPQCCTGLTQLAQAAKTLADKKTACRCLKASAGGLGLQDRFLSKIPSICKIKVGFPVSTTTNCDAIH